MVMNDAPIPYAIDVLSHTGARAREEPAPRMAALVDDGDVPRELRFRGRAGGQVKRARGHVTRVTGAGDAAKSMIAQRRTVTIVMGCVR